MQLSSIDREIRARAMGISVDGDWPVTRYNDPERTERWEANRRLRDWHQAHRPVEAPNPLLARCQQLTVWVRIWRCGAITGWLAWAVTMAWAVWMVRNG